MTLLLLLPVLSAEAHPWRLGAAHALDDTVVLDRAVLGWTLDGGLVFPIVDDEGPGGFVYVGASTLEVRFPDPADGRATANRLVGLLDVPPADVTPLGRGLPLEVVVANGGVVFGADAWQSLGPVHEIERRTPGAPPIVGADGFEEIVVVDDERIDRATALAARMLEERGGWLERRWIDPADLVVPGRWVGSIHTTVDWGAYAGDTTKPRVPQRWLDWVTDPAGALIPGVKARVVAHGDRPIGWPLSEASTGDGDPRVDLTGAGVTVRLQPEWTGQRLSVAAVADLRLEAVGGTAGTVLLDVPHVVQREWYSSPTQGEIWQIVDLTDEAGRALDYRMVQLGGPSTSLAIEVRLAEPLVPGVPSTLRVRWLDACRFGHVYQTGDGNLISYGVATEPLAVLPRVRGSVGTPPVSVHAMLASMFKRVRVAVAGETLGETASEDGRYRTVDALIADGDAWVAAGQWHERRSNGRPDLVVYALQGWEDAQDRIVSRVRGASSGRRVGALTVVEGASNVEGPRVEGAGRGLIWHSERRFGEEQSALQGLELHTSLEAEDWAPGVMPPPSRRLQTALQRSAAIARYEKLEKSARTELLWAATRSELPTSLREDEEGELDPSAVLWLVGRTLPAQLGADAFDGAIGRLRRGELPSTWDGLEAAIGEATGEDPSDLFVTWRDSGVPPTVDLRWRWEPGVVRGTVRSDLPFGSFVVPLRLRGDGAEIEAEVRVTDGSGTFAVPWAGERAPTVDADPDHALWTGGVTVERD